MAERVIEIRGLRKSYGDLEAVAGIDLYVDRGEIFALLGPNGAGKTTTTEILEGYRAAIGGRRSRSLGTTRRAASMRFGNGSASCCSRPGWTRS